MGILCSLYGINVRVTVNFSFLVSDINCLRGMDYYSQEFLIIFFEYCSGLFFY